MRMLVPRNEPVDPVTFAGIAAHEMAHARGVDHRTMKGAERYDWNAGDRRARYSWADEFIVLRKMALNDPGEERAKRLRHAEGKLKEARTRAKRAATLLKKWERRVARLS